MALTANCDVYVAIFDAGIDRVVKAVFRQRPSMFNFGTSFFVHRPDRLCEKIDADPIVLAKGNPLVGPVSPLPIALTPYTTEYCFQVTTLQVDFHPGDVIQLPPELDPLGEQLLAVQGGACFAFGCPPTAYVEHLPPLPPLSPAQRERKEKQPPIGLPIGHLLCTCLDIFATLGFDFVGATGSQHLAGSLEGVEIVDIAPDTLESSIECYLASVVRLGLLPRLQSQKVLFASDPTDPLIISIEPTLASAALPNNPAVEDDQLKVFFDLTATPGPPQPPPQQGGGGGGASPPADPGVAVQRIRADAYDATAAISEPAVQELFNAVRDGFSKHFASPNPLQLGPFSLSFSGDARLENGVIDLRADGSIALTGLDLVFNPFVLTFTVDLPPIVIPGFCIIPTPFGCAFGFPDIHLWDPHLTISIDIGPFLRFKLSAELTPLSKYAINPARAGMNDWDAVEAKHPNHWQIYIDPGAIHADPDFSGIGDVLAHLVEQQFDSALVAFIPSELGFIAGLIESIANPIIHELVTDAFDAVGDIEQWLSDHIGLNLLLTLVADHLAKDHPLVQIPDPLTLMPATSNLIPVLMPIAFLGVSVDADEMALEVDLGG